MNNPINIIGNLKKDNLYKLYLAVIDNKNKFEIENVFKENNENNNEGDIVFWNVQKKTVKLWTIRINYR